MPNCGCWNPIDWSPAGDLILAGDQSASGSALYLLDANYQNERRLTTRRLARSPAGFSADGRQVLGIFQNTTGDGTEWQLYAFDVDTGAERLLADLDLPVNVGELDSFSLHPDGTRFATSIAKWPYDIWMLEGFE